MPNEIRDGSQTGWRRQGQIRGSLDEMVGDMFPEIREGVVVRPSLGMEDLSLIRKGFIEMAASDRYGRDVARARDLMKRMLRKVK